MGRLEDRLTELGLELPEVPGAGGNILGAIQARGLVSTSSRAPISEGTFVYRGRLGEDLNTQDGYLAARLAMLNALATIKGTIGSLDAIERIVKLTGWINSTPAFDGLREVLNGASDLLIELLGDRGRHARVVAGVCALPHNVAIEIDVIAEINEAT